MMTTWKTLLGFLLFPQFLIYSFKVSLDECVEIETSTFMWFFTLIVECLFVLDFILNFLTVQRDMRSPFTLRKSVGAYLTSYFLLDFTATIIGNILFLVPTHSAELWRIRLKLVRIFRVTYMQIAYKGAIVKLTANIPKLQKTIQFILTGIFECIFWLHVMTCIWIKLGSLDKHNDRWLTTPENERTWMFVTG